MLGLMVLLEVSSSSANELRRGSVSGAAAGADGSDLAGIIISPGIQPKDYMLDGERIAPDGEETTARG
ncbi:hypothetical protein CSOJ01_07850 [Colletotrichum sojae]|uniref:Uncharacterized protein n=1 Tax=Colletotrichum sojae TaxID=2175907 RepID=A0A8H6MTP8_9PEZI|nr:hypothetical protein CSOJ01_07850 [Colletotrichum sojae]